MSNGNDNLKVKNPTEDGRVSRPEELDNLNSYRVIIVDHQFNLSHLLQ